MACLEIMYNNNNCPPISPRISFSNDFVDSQQMLKQHHQDQIRRNSSNSSNSNSDFEFNSVSNYSMMSADELFSKGRLLPFKNTTTSNSSSSSNQTQRTIRDELLSGDDDINLDQSTISLRPPKGASSTRWKGLLGLKRTHIGSKKIDNNNNNTETRRPSGFAHELPKNSQEYLSNDQGGSSHRDVEIGI